MRRLVFAVVFSGCVGVDNPLIGGDGGGTASSGTGGGTASGTGGGSTGGSGGGTTSGTGGGTTSGTGGGTVTGTGGGTAGCSEDWQCGNWRMSTGGNATRSCIDLNACGTAVNKPGVGPTPVPNLDRNYYRCNVQPVFDKSCAMMGCHGTDTARDFRTYSRGRLRNNEMVPAVSSCLDTGMRNLQVEGSGTVMCLGWTRLTPAEWQKNYDSARLFATGLTDQTQNPLLTQPQRGTTFAHAGIKTYSSGEAPYETVKTWLQGATAPATCDGGMN